MQNCTLEYTRYRTGNYIQMMLHLALIFSSDKGNICDHFSSFLLRSMRKCISLSWIYLIFVSSVNKANKAIGRKLELGLLRISTFDVPLVRRNNFSLTSVFLSFRHTFLECLQKNIPLDFKLGKSIKFKTLTHYDKPMIISKFCTDGHIRKGTLLVS